MQLDEILSLDRALEQPDEADQRLRQAVELRFFGGLSEEEIAQLLGVSTRTVERDWLTGRFDLKDVRDDLDRGHRHAAATTEARALLESLRVRR